MRGVDCDFFCRSRLLLISVSIDEFKLVLLDRTCDRVVILFGDSDDDIGVILMSAQGGRGFVMRVVRFVGARMDLFSFNCRSIVRAC